MHSADGQDANAVPTPLVTVSLADALAARKAGDPVTALRLLRSLAVQGNPQAQLQLGMAYSTGDGVAQEAAAALHWFRQAAEQGLADAQFNVGWHYENGSGVSRDYGEALRWYRLAANQGEAEAQGRLGVLYQCVTCRGTFIQPWVESEPKLRRLARVEQWGQVRSPGRAASRPPLP